MRLAGYLKALKENSFAIPVYTDKTQYYFHSVDETYKITEFYNADISLNQIIECYISDSFEINDYAAIVFVGRQNYINSNQLNKGIEEIKKYLEETTLEKEFLNIKEDVNYFINCLVSEINKEDWIPAYDILQKSIYRKSLIGEKNITDLHSRIDITDYLIEESFSKFLSESNYLSKLLIENHELHVNFTNYVIENESNLSLKNAMLAKLNGIIFTKGNRKSLKEFNHRFLKTVSVEPIKHTSFPVVGFTEVQIEDDGSIRVLPPMDIRMDMRMDMRVSPMDMISFPDTGYYPKFHYGYGPNDEVQNPSKKVLRKKK